MAHSRVAGRPGSPPAVLASAVAWPVEAVRRGLWGVDSAREMANPASLERSPPELDTGTGRRGRERRRATDPTARSPKVGDSLAYGPPGQRKCEWTACVPHGPVLVGRADGGTASPVEASRILPARAAGHCGCCRRGGHALPCCALSGHHVGVRAGLDPAIMRAAGEPVVRRRRRAARDSGRRGGCRRCRST